MTNVHGDDRATATAMFETGKALQLQGNGAAGTQALAAYDDLVARFRHSRDPLVACRVGDALTWGAHVYMHQDSPGRALARYQQTIDMLEGWPDDLFRRNLDQVNPGVEVIEVSARTGDGLDAWLAWLERATS